MSDSVYVHSLLPKRTRKPVVGINRINEAIVPIFMVLETGLKCDCICYDCGMPLEAVLNTRKRKHFRHSNKANCSLSPETQLHLLAKYIIEHSREILVPGKGIANYENPVIEVRLGNLIPDAIIDLGNEKLFIEIIVTNPVTLDKKQKYSESGATVLQIFLEKTDRNLAYADLRQLVLFESGNREILRYKGEDERLPNTGDKKNNSFIVYWIALASAGLAIWYFFFKKRKY